MAKFIEIENNPLEVGMTFSTYAEIGRFLGVKDLRHGNVIIASMKHYCKWHKEENGIIYIDEVFDEVIPFRTKGFRYEIGEIIEVNTGKYIIKNRYIGDDPVHKSRNNAKANIYKCECLIDGFEFELPETRIIFGLGCPICGNRKLIPGIRTLYDQHPEILKYLVNPEEAKEITPSSNKYVLCKCPECGHEKKIMVSNLVQHGFSCPICSDGVSYPNKFVREVLNQLNVDYEPEAGFEWSDGRRYDQYIQELNMIIENHGRQHYEEGFERLGGRTLEEEQENDKYKYQLAFNNGIEKYIVLDCRKSDLDWIKKSILNSELVNIYNFKEDDIDWSKCHIIASTNSEIRKICEAYNSNKNITDLSENFKIDKHTISDYLQIGALCGYCEFEKNNNQKNGRALLWQANAKPIYCVTDNIYFMTKKDCEEYYKLHGENINGKGLYKYINTNLFYKDRKFIYISKYEYNKVYDKNDKNYLVVGDRFIDRYVKEE